MTAGKGLETMVERRIRRTLHMFDAPVIGDMPDAPAKRMRAELKRRDEYDAASRLARDEREVHESAEAQPQTSQQPPAGPGTALATVPLASARVGASGASSSASSSALAAPMRYEYSAQVARRQASKWPRPAWHALVSLGQHRQRARTMVRLRQS